MGFGGINLFQSLKLWKRCPKLWKRWIDKSYSYGIKTEIRNQYLRHFDAGFGLVVFQ